MFIGHRSSLYLSIFQGLTEAQGKADTETIAYAAYAPLDRHIHVRSSTRDIKVGEYAVFHTKVL